MSNFEFVFSLLVILLSLALAEVLGGLARIVKRRPPIRIGWATGLLATWVTTETVLFWRVVWRARTALTDQSAVLFGGFIVTAFCYFAAALVFPDDLEGRSDLDEYFAQEKAKVIGALLAANALALGLRPAIMGPASWTYVEWWGWFLFALLFAAAAAAMLTKRRKVAIACLAVLVTIDLLDPVESLLTSS
jgi:hypothetical protein